METPVATAGTKSALRSVPWPLAVTALLSVLIAIVSFRYLLPGLREAAPPSILDNAMRTPWLLVHVAGAATALLVCSAQFFSGLRARSIALHRLLGRVYVVGCVIGGVSGLLLAYGTSSGPVATAGFGLLAVAWLATTLLAWRYAIGRDIKRHRRWMTRSFSLTLAAVTLRLYLPLSELLPFDKLDSYRAISFLCWVPNLLIAEVLYVRGQR
jgi:uncharacterized membrane protein